MSGADRNPRRSRRGGRQYTPISAEQLAAQTDGLAHLLDERLLVWLEKAGRPVAFIVAVPDVSEFLMAVGGRRAW